MQVKVPNRYSDGKFLLSVCSSDHISLVSQQISLKIHRRNVLYSVYIPAKLQCDPVKIKRNAILFL